MMTVSQIAAHKREEKYQERINPGALCMNCIHCHIPVIEWEYAYEMQGCRHPDSTKISGIGHADTCPAYER